MLEKLPLLGLTAPALLGIAVLLLLTGRLIPRPTLQDKAQEAKDWKEAYQAEREARATSDQQTRELLEVSKTTHAISVAMFDAIRQNAAQRGGTDVAQED